MNELSETQSQEYALVEEAEELINQALEKLQVAAGLSLRDWGKSSLIAQIKGLVKNDNPIARDLQTWKCMIECAADE